MKKNQTRGFFQQIFEEKLQFCHRGIMNSNYLDDIQSQMEQKSFKIIIEIPLKD